MNKFIWEEQMQVNKNNMEPIMPLSLSLVTAFKFKIDMNLEELRTHLSTRIKEGEWVSKSSGYHGDYIGIRKENTSTIIRIFTLPGGYMVVDMLNKTSEPRDKWEKEIAELQAILTEKGVENFFPAENKY
jgi:hypothetical protein